MASNTQPSPVTEQDYLEAKEQLANLDIADREIAKAKRAGIDMSAQEAASRESRTKLQQILQTYFPGR